MRLLVVALLFFLELKKKADGELKPSDKHGDNVMSAKEFATLMESASKIMNSFIQEDKGMTRSMQVSFAIQSSSSGKSYVEHPSTRGEADVTPKNEWTANKTRCPPIEETPHSRARDCSSLQQSGVSENGVYKIWPKFLDHPVNVYCDMKSDGGGWTVIQRRGDYEPHVNFYETWDKYREGFGDLNKEFWLGNDAIFALTNQRRTRLRIELEDFEGNKRHAEYGKFLIRSEVENYRTIIEHYQGSAGDAMKHHNDTDFSTKDKAVNDCSAKYKGGWWYKSCHLANLNGLYLHGNHDSFADGVEWQPFKGYHHSLKTTEMKIRPANR